MTAFSEAIIKDLSDAQSLYRLKQHFDLATLMGTLQNLIKNSATLIEAENYSTLQEFRFYREALNKQIDWESSQGSITAVDAIEARRLVDELTETDYFL